MLTFLEQQGRVAHLQHLLVKALAASGEDLIEIQIEALILCLATRSRWLLEAERDSDSGPDAERSDDPRLETLRSAVKHMPPMLKRKRIRVVTDESGRHCGRVCLIGDWDGWIELPSLSSREAAYSEAYREALIDREWEVQRS